MPLPPQAWVCCVVDSAHMVRQAHPRIKYGAGYELVNETMPAKAGIQRGVCGGVDSSLRRPLRNTRGSSVECHSEPFGYAQDKLREESEGFYPKTAQFCEQRLWIPHFAALRSE